MTEMDIQVIKDSLQSIKDKGFKFIISGPKFNKNIVMTKGDKGICLYKGYFDRGQKWNSQQGSFRLAEKMNSIFKEEGRMIQVTPALLRAYIIDAAEVKEVKKMF